MHLTQRLAIVRPLCIYNLLPMPANIPNTCIQHTFNIHLPQVQVVGEGGRVRSNGVLLENGEAVEAEAVVCNADLPYAEKELLPDSVSRSFEVRLPS